MRKYIRVHAPDCRPGSAAAPESTGNAVGAVHEFEGQAPALGRTSGTDLSYELAQPLAMLLYHAGDLAHAKQVLQTPREIVRPHPGYPIDVAMKDLEELFQTPPRTVVALPRPNA